MSNIQTGAERMPHDLSHLGFLAGQIGRLITISTTPVIAGDSFEMDAVGALRLSPLRRGLAIDSTVDIFTFYVPHRHVYGEQWIKFMKDGVNATPPPTVNTTGYIDHAAFLGTINPDTNKIPKHLFQGYLDRKSGSAGMPRPISYAVFCLKKNVTHVGRSGRLQTRSKEHTSTLQSQSNLLCRILYRKKI